MTLLSISDHAAIHDRQPARLRPSVDWEDFHLISELLAKVHDEMGRQDLRWGKQGHPLTLDAYATHLVDAVPFSRAAYENMAEEWKANNDVREAAGCLGWDGILLEEVFEALSEDDPGLACNELIQVAAVALQAALSIDRNGMRGAA